MEWAEIFSEGRTAAFILLFTRFSALFMAVPIFSHANIPMSVKAAMAFFFTVFFFGALPPLQIPFGCRQFNRSDIGRDAFWAYGRNYIATCLSRYYICGGANIVYDGIFTGFGN